MVQSSSNAISNLLHKAINGKNACYCFEELLMDFRSSKKSHFNNCFDIREKVNGIGEKTFTEMISAFRSV